MRARAFAGHPALLSRASPNPPAQRRSCAVLHVVAAEGARADSELGRNAGPSVQAALKLRARELARLGLATEVRRNVLVFSPAWRERLRTMELHLDIRKNLLQSRSLGQSTGINKLPGLLR